MSFFAAVRPRTAALTCVVAIAFAAVAVAHPSSPRNSSSSRNPSSSSSSKKASKSPSKVSAKSPQKINNSDAGEPAGFGAWFKKLFGIGEKKSKKAPSSKNRINSIAGFEDLDYGPADDQKPSPVADVLPTYDSVPNPYDVVPNPYDVVPSEQGNQAGGGQYQPGPIVQNANSPYAPGPVVHPYDLRGLKVQANQGNDQAAAQPNNQYSNVGLKINANKGAAPDAGVAAMVADAAGNVALSKPVIEYGKLGSNPAPPDQDYALAPANPQARADWKVKAPPLGLQNGLARNQFAGKSTIEIAEIIDPSFRPQGGAGGNSPRGNIAGGNNAGRAGGGIGQGGQNLGAMAGFNRTPGQSYFLPTRVAPLTVQTAYPNISKKK